MTKKRHYSSQPKHRSRLYQEALGDQQSRLEAYFAPLATRITQSQGQENLMDLEETEEEGIYLGKRTPLNSLTNFN